LGGKRSQFPVGWYKKWENIQNTSDFHDLIKEKGRRKRG
jgi:hypothetical protein